MSFTDEEILTEDNPINNEEIEISSDKIEIIDENVENGEISINTNNDSELVEYDGSLPDYAILNPDIPMIEKVAVATKVADCLSDLIEKQGLMKRGLNKKDPQKEYVLVEGWQVLGTMLGITPVTEVTGEITNNKGRIIGYKARATLYRNPIMENGEVVGGELLSRTEASADKSGRQTDGPGMMSMAQTRALGKAYRMTLSWIIKMAGYEGTPAEEMPTFRAND